MEELPQPPQTDSEKETPTRHSSYVTHASTIFLFSITLLAVGIGIGYLLFGSAKTIRMKAQITQTPTKEVATSSASPYRTYVKLGVVFQYPSNATIKEDTNGTTQYIVDFTLNGKEFSMDRLQTDTTNDPPYYPKPKMQTFNGILWRVASPSPADKVCDAGNCSGLAPTYYVFHNGYQYRFVYYSTELKDTVEKILTTFNFTN